MVQKVLYSPKYKYCVYYCAKSGCSSLRNLFIELHKSELTPEQQKEVNSHNCHEFFTLPTNKNQEAVDKMRKFILVRNPYTRIVSAYVNKYIGGENSMIQKRMKKQDITNPHGNTFLGFLRFIYDLKKKNMLNSIDDHLNEQSFNLSENDNATVIQLENFEEQVLKFYKGISKTLYNRVLEIIENKTVNLRANKTKYDDDSNVDYGQVFNVDFNISEPMKSYPSYKAFYNSECNELVYKIYTNDFKRFAYSSKLPF